IELVGWNDISWVWVANDLRGICGVSRGGVWVVDLVGEFWTAETVGAYGSGAQHRRKVAHPHGIRESSREVGLSLFGTESFPVAGKPCIVLYHGATKVDTILVLLVRIRCRRRVGLGIQDAVADELVRCAMELIRARTSDNIDVCSRTNCELSVGDVGLDIKLLPRIRRRTNSKCVRKQCIVENAIHCVVVLLGP